MGYRVIYLDGREIKGKGELPKIGCNVCREIKRNVIEPVAIFVEEKEVEEIENKLIELQEEFGNQEEILKEKVKKLAQEIHKEQDGKTCIFHCEKENEIWMENAEEYKEWKEINEDIKWDKNLVDEFWRRVRAYRFAVDYLDKLYNDMNWNNFINNNFRNIGDSENYKTFLSELNKNQKLILEFFERLLLKYPEPYISLPQEYNFQNFKFVPFNIRSRKNKPLKKYDFWYDGEEKVFKRKTTFNGANFCGTATFDNVTFEKFVDFSSTEFS